VGKRWVGIKGGATGIVPVPLAIVRARPLPSASQPIESSRVGDSFDAQHERSSRFTRLSCVAVDVVRIERMALLSVKPTRYERAHVTKERTQDCTWSH
jgi:hypothetical protein